MLFTDSTYKKRAEKEFDFTVVRVTAAVIVNELLVYEKRSNALRMT